MKTPPTFRFFPSFTVIGPLSVIAITLIRQNVRTEGDLFLRIAET